MKILVLGSTGYVGQHLIESLIHDGLLAVAGASRSSTRKVFPEVAQEFILDLALDGKDLTQQLQAVVEWNPDVVVNCAACASLGVCEKDPDLAMRVNRPLELVNALANKQMSIKKAGPPAGRLLVHLSTDIVFGGTKPGTYTEDDPVSPVNAYGRSKAAMDSALQMSTSAAGSESVPDEDGIVGSDRVVVGTGIRSIILRPTNIIGEPAPRIDRPKFLQWLANRIKDQDPEPVVGASSSSGGDAATSPSKCSQEQTKCFDDEFRSYVYIGDVVALIKSVIHDEAVRICRESREADSDDRAGAAGGKKSGASSSSSSSGPEAETPARGTATSGAGAGQEPPTAQDIAALLTDPVTGKKFSDMKKSSDAAAAGASGSSAGGDSAASSTERAASSSTESTLPGIFGANKWQTVSACGPTWSNRVDVARAVLKAGGWADRWPGMDGEEGAEKVVPVSRLSIDLGYKSPLVLKMDPSRCASVLRREPIGVEEVCRRVFGRRDTDTPAGAGEAT